MIIENCKYCSIPEKKFAISDYFETISKWTKYVDKGIFKLVVGDCPLKDLSKHVSKEEKQTYYHYFKCTCGNYCRSGVYIRSSVPILEKLDKLPDDLISSYKMKTNIVIGNDYS